MSLHTPDPRLAPFLLAVALLTAGLSVAAVTQLPASSAAGAGPTSGDDQANKTGGDPNGSASGSDGEPNGTRNGTADGSSEDTNRTREDGNRTSDERSGSPDGRNASAGDEGRREGAQDQGQRERGRAPPVEIEDRPGGFATRAPPGSPRPSVAVDASQARLEVDHPTASPLEMQFDAVLVYVDTDADGAYDLGEPVHARTDLRGAENRVRQGDEPDQRHVTYALANGGELVLRFDLGRDHAPSVATKFDVIIRNQTYDRDELRLALGAHLGSADGMETVQLDGHPALAGDGSDQAGYLSWVPTVQVDGAEHPVRWSTHVSTSPGDASAIVYWSYPTGDEIVHDPTLGVTAAIEDLAGQIPAFAVGLAATVTILGSGYLVRRRWRL